jgi:hypothetical protein
VTTDGSFFYQPFFVDKVHALKEKIRTGIIIKDI